MMDLKYQIYPDYRNPNIEWIKEIPADWAISYLGFECSVKARLGWKGLKAEEYVDEGYIFLATPNIKNSEIDFNHVNRITKNRYYESPEIMLELGDILVTKDGSTTGTTNIVKHLPEPATVNSSIAVLRSAGGLQSNFLYYFFVSEYTQNIINRMRGGMGVPHLFQADLRKFNILVPPKKEQQQIANFLDHETAKIDTLIDKQQQLIKLLKEKRQAVISHAVTKGLNPNVPMKDSGVEWLGDVPEHWDVSRIKHHTRLFEQGWSPQCDSRPADGNEYGVLKVGCVNNGTFNSMENKALPAELTPQLQYLIRKGDLLISRANTKELVGSAAVVEESHNNLILCDKLYRLRFDQNVNSQFISYYLALPIVRQQIELGATGASHSMQNIGQSTIKELPVLIPPISEANALFEELKIKTNKFDDILLKSEASIILLNERRTALISAAVTGKIDVRNWTPEQSQPSMEATA
ncbi:type I restriction enzyme, S subunit [Amphritea atlantica]|uniref:Type I restriction enzyme, S subunit n=1 Tax=Amphritea atlantica TaxID=355243 RepID=A0A1H9ILX8_9GAMM|nr:restriction endonuclease subunit S [Amphritea atlantica]SEQ75566.1 type I restriction enzyme, S subunit [Amphritea atlantica]